MFRAIYINTARIVQKIESPLKFGYLFGIFESKEFEFPKNWVKNLIFADPIIIHCTEYTVNIKKCAAAQKDIKLCYLTFKIVDGLSIDGVIKP